jgi:hypothetical protein
MSALSSSPKPQAHAAAILATPSISISSPETPPLKANPSISLEALLLSWLRYLSRRAQERILTIKSRFLDHVSKRATHRIPHLRRLFTLRGPDAEFDKKLGVDTKGPIKLSNLHILSENVAHAIRYEAVNPSIFRQALRSIPENFANFTFINLGCGKGRTLLLANEFDLHNPFGGGIYLRQLGAGELSACLKHWHNKYNPRFILSRNFTI